MNATFITTIVGFFGSLAVAFFTYWSTKRREREAEWRKEKLAYYKAFVESMSEIVEGDATPEGHRLYAKATNNLLLFAPQPVIAALNAYRSECCISNQRRSQEEHDKLLAALLLAIRKDIGVSPEDEAATFKPILWASGVGKDAT
jgi:hypothetical protein